MQTCSIFPACLPTDGESLWPSRSPFCGTWERGILAVQRTAMELGKRCFSVAAPIIWNGLPDLSKDTFDGD